MAALGFISAIHQLCETHSYSEDIRELLNMMLHGKSTIHFLDYIDDRNLGLAHIKGQAMEVVLDYAQLILEDNVLSQDEIFNIRYLRRFFNIEDGEFLEYSKRARVEAILIEQLEKLYADNKIDKEEMLHKSEMQGLFGLGYDDYQEIVNKVAIEAYSRGADLKDLDTYL